VLLKHATSTYKKTKLNESLELFSQKQRMEGHCRMKCQGLYLGSPCKDSWFEVDRWVIKIVNALGVAVPLALGENQWRCSKMPVLEQRIGS
jgi:hypothetical protein